MVSSAVVVALSQRRVHAGAGLIAAYLAVGDERAGTTLPAKFVKRAVVSPGYIPNGSGLSLNGISPWYRRISPIDPTALSVTDETKLAILPLDAVKKVVSNEVKETEGTVILSVVKLPIVAFVNLALAPDMIPVETKFVIVPLEAVKKVVLIFVPVIVTTVK